MRRTLTYPHAVDRRLAMDDRGSAPRNPGDAIMCVARGPHNVVQFANEAFLALVGRGSVRGERLANLLPVDDRRALEHALGQVRWTGEPRAFQELAFAPHDSDAIRYVSLVVSPIPGRNRRIEGITIYGMDVTAMVEARHEAQRINRRLGTLSAATGQVVFLADRDGRVEFIGDAWEVFTGAGADAGGDWNWASFVHPEDVHAVLTAWRNALETRSAVHLQWRLRHHEGGYHWNRVKVVPVFNDAGEVEEWVGTATDLEEIRAARQAQLKSETELALVLEESGMGNWSRNIDSDVVELSPRASELMGIAPRRSCPSDELIQSIVLAEDREQLREIARLAVENRVPLDAEFRVRHPEMGVRSIHVRGAVLNGEEGAGRLVGTIADVTDARAYEAELLSARNTLEEVARLKDALLANMSHEIRTPLTSVMGYAEILKSELEGEHKEMADVVYANGRRLLSTLEAVLELAQLESGVVQLNPSKVEVVRFLQELVARFEPAAIERGLFLKLECDVGRLPAEFDEGGLRRILSHLLDNAIKFTSEGGVKVVLRPSADDVVIDVVDTGIGIDEKRLPSLFSAFAQESSGLSRTYEGPGLGLTVTSKLVHLMGGTLAVKTSKGRGTTFTVRLPILRTPSADATLPRVLILERREDIRYRLATALGAHAHITFSNCPHAALRLIQANRFDAVIVDVALTESISTAAFIRRVRRRTIGTRVPMIACTSYVLPQERNRLLEMGFDDVLRKPFEPDAVRRSLAHWIERNRAADLSGHR